VVTRLIADKAITIDNSQAKQLLITLFGLSITPGDGLS
jgi:hypothetical protein